MENTEITTKEFNVLTQFTVKAATTPAHDPGMVPEDMGEILKFSGCANFSGLIEQGNAFIDMVGEVVVPSGIDVTVWKSNPQILLQHDRNYTIGRGLSVTKKKDGLYIEGEIHAGAMEDEAFYRIKAGLLSYLSVGFRTISVEYKKVGDKMACFITKCLLAEVSIVSIPCNSKSPFQVIKSLPEDGGFYAGELTSKEDEVVVVTLETETNKEDQGENMKVMRRELLSAEKVKAFEELGLAADLDTEKELTFPELVQAVTDQVFAKIAEKEAAAATEKAAVEAELEATKAAELEATKAAELAAAEALELEAKEAFTDEEKDAVKSLSETLAELKKVLDAE
jgi:HK97 family phage prohead protease